MGLFKNVCRVLGLSMSGAERAGELESRSQEAGGGRRRKQVKGEK
jgi:hypothetical protein